MRCNRADVADRGTDARLARRRSRYAWAAAAVWVGAVAAGQWLGRTAGSTRAERRQMLPGDELVDHPTVVTNHAVTIPAPPDRVWPWLVQMGWHRGGWYTARWVDWLLFPANWPSATELVPELQRPLAVGDRIPDGPPDTAWFVVEHVNSPRRWSCTPPRICPLPGGPGWAPRSTGHGRSPWLTPTTAAPACCCGSGGGPGHGG
jgi:hypothetical protein